jgi:hypothetical protein
LHVESPSICGPQISSKTAENTAAWAASCFVAKAESCSRYGKAKGRRITWFIKPEQKSLEQKRIGLAEPHESCNSLAVPSLKIYHCKGHRRRIPCRAGRKGIRGDFALHSSDCVPGTFNHFPKPSSCDACFDSRSQRASNNTHGCAEKLIGWCRFFATHNDFNRQPLLFFRDKRTCERSETRGGRANSNASSRTIVLPVRFGVMQTSDRKLARQFGRPRRSKILQKTSFKLAHFRMLARAGVAFRGGIIGVQAGRQQGRLSCGELSTSVEPNMLLGSAGASAESVFHAAWFLKLEFFFAEQLFRPAVRWLVRTAVALSKAVQPRERVKKLHGC